MTRWFYSDPLAAAWMAKHFGMRFVRLDGNMVNLSHSSWERKGRDGLISFVAVPERRDSIHNDSLHLLAVQSGDVIQCGNRQASVLVGQPPFAEQTTANAQANVTDYGFRIIQRDGKAFHWPEVER